LYCKDFILTGRQKKPLTVCNPTSGHYQNRLIQKNYCAGFPNFWSVT